MAAGPCFNLVPFHSYQFIIFFSLVYVSYWGLRQSSRQNFLLLFASYIFYALWDIRFLILLFFQTLASYFFGQKIYESASHKNLLLWISVLLQLFVLCFFKYLDFFVHTLHRILPSLIGKPHFNILLPLGISFYTFKAISYLVDIYRGQLEPCKKARDYALYIAFFPQMAAGPIDRPGELIPQLNAERTWQAQAFYEGCFMILWGFVQKMFVADNLAKIVHPVFDSTGSWNAPSTILASYAYSFQLYCDFAAYSMLAWGFAKLLGFQTTHNFDQPFSATNIQGFWNRWHISLSRWIKDYVYIPIFMTARFLGSGMLRVFAATLISMFAMGLWHGAGMHYVIFGVYHGILLCLYAFFRPWLQKIKFKSGLAQNLWTLACIFFMFQLSTLGFMIFRAPSMARFFEILSGSVQNLRPGPGLVQTLSDFLFYVWLVLLVEFFQYKTKDRFVVFRWSVPVKAIFYLTCFILLSLYGGGHGQTEYIYFQF